MPHITQICLTERISSVLYTTQFHKDVSGMTQIKIQDLLYLQQFLQNKQIRAVVEPVKSLILFLEFGSVGLHVGSVPTCELQL